MENSSKDTPEQQVSAHKKNNETGLHTADSLALQVGDVDSLDSFHHDSPSLVVDESVVNFSDNLMFSEPIAEPVFYANVDFNEQPDPEPKGFDQQVGHLPLDDVFSQNNHGLDQGLELTMLASQIVALENQYQNFSQQMAGKASKDELLECKNDVRQLQNEQKKYKRNTAQLPMAAQPWLLYAAAGLAVFAAVMSVFIGSQLQQSSQKIAELEQQNLQLSQQLTAQQSESADTGEQLSEQIQKKLDELSAADLAFASQIAAMQKSLKAEAASSKINANLSKQLDDLSNQKKQTDVALLALESKVAAFEKAKAVVTPPPQAAKSMDDDTWAVSLVAFKQDWYAKRVAEDYASKGVKTKVNKILAKGENWYRLTVDGFKSQTDANAYAAKVKKILNLDSVSVLHESLGRD